MYCLVQRLLVTSSGRWGMDILA